MTCSNLCMTFDFTNLMTTYQMRVGNKKEEEVKEARNYKKETEMKYLKIEKARYVGSLKVELTFNDGVVVVISNCLS